MTTRWMTLVALGALACGHQAATAGPGTDAEYSMQQAGDSIPLGFGRLVLVGGHYFQLTDVPSDSRCAKGVQCVWAGDAVASIAIHPGCYKAGCKAASFLLQLHTNLEPRAGGAAGLKVQLVSLVPEPVSGKPTDKASYAAWVRITPAS